MFNKKYKGERGNGNKQIRFNYKRILFLQKKKHKS
jgi:hypothetical protein